MVKGVSKQVILVHSPETQLFEQAICILIDNAQTVTDEMLLKEAKRIVNISPKKKRLNGPMWACAGAAAKGILWAISIFL